MSSGGKTRLPSPFYLVDIVHFVHPQRPDIHRAGSIKCEYQAFRLEVSRVYDSLYRSNIIDHA